jgi:hypothetical protein
MSMVQTHSQRTLTSEVKYFKILMQEFSVKLDIIFLNTLAAFFLENVTLYKSPPPLEFEIISFLCFPAQCSQKVHPRLEEIQQGTARHQALLP